MKKTARWFDTYSVGKIKNSLLSGATTYFLARTLKKISRLTVKKKCPTGNPSLKNYKYFLGHPLYMTTFRAPWGDVKMASSRFLGVLGHDNNSTDHQNWWGKFSNSQNNHHGRPYWWWSGSIITECISSWMIIKSHERNTSRFIIVVWFFTEESRKASHTHSKFTTCRHDEVK